MRFGICLPNYGEQISIEGIKKIALEAENLGYESVWTTDHILMSQNSRTPYENMHDSIVSLAYVASITNKIKLGISSLVLAMRNPVIVAKQLATIDNISNGRLILATGAGWNEREFENLGADFKNRGKILNESIKLIRILWESSAPIDFKGKYLKISIVDGVFSPKPVQKKLPIWIAGNSISAIKRAIKYGDAWHPNIYLLANFKPLVEKYLELGGKYIAGRIGVDITSEKNEYISPQGERRILLSANMNENVKIIEALESMNVKELILAVNYNGKISIESQLEAIRKFQKLL